MLEKHNLVIICKDCGKEFDFTIGEQEFYDQMGFDKPIRCKECRDKKKQEREKFTKEMLGTKNEEN